MKTLNEVVEIVGFSRRVIQEYEDEGLAIKPNNTNKYGHLQYDNNALERLWQLRFYKELGYDKKKIKSIMEASNYDKKKELEKVIDSLEKEKEKLDNLIGIAQMMKETGISFSALRFGIKELEDTNFDEISSMLGAMFTIFKPTADEEINFEEALTEEDLDALFAAFEKIMNLCEKGMDISSEEVQCQIALMHEITSKKLSKSIMVFLWTSLCLSPDSEMATEIDKDYGKGKAAYFYNALQHYCSVNADNEADKEFNTALENIAELGMKKYTTSSDEVQSEVKKLYHFYNGISVLSEKAKLGMLRNMAQLYGSRAYINAFDNGADKGISWFISRAITIYCDRLEKGL